MILLRGQIVLFLKIVRSISIHKLLHSIITRINVTTIIQDGPFFQRFLNDPRYGQVDIQTIMQTVQKLLDTETNLDRPGMLLGKIQSGKTKTFIAIIALAFDSGFDGAIILTKGTKALSKQTIERISKEFKDFTDREMLQSYDVMTMPKKLTGY